MHIMYLFLCILYAPLQGAVSSTKSVIMARDCGAAPSTDPQVLHCLSAVPGLKKPLCFCTSEEKDVYVTTFMQAGKHIWYRLQEEMLSPIDPEAIFDESFFPHQDEPLVSFLQRTEAKITHEMNSYGLGLHLKKDMREDFAGIPWTVLKYILAVNLRLGVLKPDAVVPKLAATFLDLAVRHKDEESIFFGIELGAREMINPSSEAELLRHMLQSFDTRSVQVLKEMSDDGVIVALPTYEWGTHLSPEFAAKKLYAITGADLNRRGILKSKFCIPACEVRKQRDDTPEAQALKIAMLSLSDLKNCEDASAWEPFESRLF